MKWFHDMSEQEKQSFKKVIAVCAAGAAFILLIPAVFPFWGEKLRHIPVEVILLETIRQQGSADK